jgi:hypothetical protein
LAKRGRPKGTGKREDDDVLREAFKAYRDGKYRTERAAATEYAKRLPGEDEEVNRDRLYRKMRERRPELEAELEAERERQDGQVETMEEQAELLASELAGWSTAYKQEYLSRLFSILIENQEAHSRVLDRLREEGTDPPPEFMAHLDNIMAKIVKKEREAFEASGLVKVMKRLYRHGYHITPKKSEP